jgi:hypothetical protein
MKLFAAALATATLGSILAACATTAAGTNPHHTGTALIATLDGKAEVPGPGDPDGTGEFAAWVDPAMGRVCYTLGTASIGTPTMAHIHRGDPQVAGPVVVPLQTPTHDIADACTPVAAALANEIVADPAAFYVNVHTADLPKGAIRAQLKRPG